MSAVTHGGNLFAVARERGWDWREVLDLSASINPLGPAPGVRQAIIDALDSIVHYPDRYSRRVVERLSQLWDIAPETILVGNGATDLIHFIARVWPQERVTLAIPTFSEFHRAWPDAQTALWTDLPSWPTEGLFVLTQPNNPIGTAVPGRLLFDWLLSTSHPVLIDESFIDWCDQPSSLAFIHERPNLLVLRSLTKFYALPGLRIGALAGDPTIMSTLAARREPWTVNVLAEAAVLAALADTKHALRSRSLVREERAWLWRRWMIRSDSNYYMLSVDNARAVCDWFLERKIIVRNCAGWPGIDGEAVRLAIRTHEENERVLDILKEYMWRS